MEKKQFNLCLEILRRFNKAAILKDFILIGSWSAYFYNEYFIGTPYDNQGEHIGSPLRAPYWVN